jgi:hypothetical protein
VERTDPGFRKVMEAVDVFRLRSPAEGASLHEDRFLDFYSSEGIQTGLEAYGFVDRLRELKLDDYAVRVEREDAFHHRLILSVGGGNDDEHRILDLRVHLCDVQVPRSMGKHSFHALQIDWLTMQNPRATFTKARPRLPGQRFPGGGLGRAMHNILIIMATRIGRDALVAVPQRFHLARLYHRAGYRFARDDDNRALEEVAAALRQVHFAAGAWAVERGFVTRVSTGEAFVYQPREMLLPLGVGLKEVLKDVASSLRTTFEATIAPTYVLDVAGLRASLVEDPVPGLDPDDLGERWF